MRWRTAAKHRKSSDRKAAARLSLARKKARLAFAYGMGATKLAQTFREAGVAASRLAGEVRRLDAWLEIVKTVQSQGKLK